MRALEERVHRCDAEIADVVAELVNVQIDMRAHHRFVHFGGVLAHVRHDRGFVGARICQTFTHRSRKRFGVGDVVAYGDRAERNGKRGRVFPPLAEVGYGDQVRVAIGEARFVNDQARVDLAGDDRVNDAVEAHDLRLGSAPERELQEQKCGGTFPRNRDRAVCETRKEFGYAARPGDHERTATAPECPARSQQAISAGEKRHGAITNLDQVVGALGRAGVEFVDVEQLGTNRRCVCE